MNAFSRRLMLWEILPILLFGCTQQRTRDSYVARVNNSYLTIEEFYKHTDTTSTSSPQAQGYVSRWISQELLFQEARRRGLDRSADIKTKIDEIEKQLIVSLLLDKEIYDEELVSFSNEELHEYYDNHTEEFLLQHDVAKINYALFQDRESAMAFRGQVLRGTSWYETADNAEMGSEEVSAILERADSAYVSEQEMFPARVWGTLIKTRIGRISSPLKTQQGYFVFQLLAFRKRGAPSELRYTLPEIRERLVVEKRRKLLDNLLNELRQRYAVEVNLDQTSEDTLYVPTKP
ncbi:MAG: peptidyl-prolyl cis-trans isomerase [Bacteroidota bacterium]